MSDENAPVKVGDDNLVRRLTLDSCYGEFLKFSLDPEDVRNQWLACEKELERLTQQIVEAEQLKVKLEARNHHVHGLLQSEVRKRLSEQQEKKEMEEKLESVRNALRDEKAISEDARLKPFLTHKRKSSGPFLQERLDTIVEVASVSSSLHEKSEEELELSGLVRSYRDVKRISGQSGEICDTELENEPIPDYDDEDNSDAMVASTTTSQSSKGPIKATTVMLTNPGMEGKSESYERKPHSYKRQAVLHSVNCLYCGQRIKFGRTALRCVECSEVCHLDCERGMPSCTGAKKKKIVTFFSPLSDSGRK